MKEFNLEEYLKDPSQKVITRDGRDVRIVCTDMRSEFPIVAIISNEDKNERVNIFTKNGRYYQTEKNSNSFLDLFFAPIKREGWVNVYKDNISTFTSGYIHQNEEQALEEALEILKEYGKFIATIKIEWEE